MLMLILSLIALCLAALPAFLFVSNRFHYRPPAAFVAATPLPFVSVLIPARNEAASIGAAVKTALASQGVDLEVLVLDDQSDDDTAAIVRELAAVDSRVRLLSAPPLPSGWCGKQHACWVLAKSATAPLFLFVDADVRLEPTGLARLVQFLHESRADLVSGVPRQETGTLLEQLVIPLIHFLLLGYLPINMMRRSPAVGFAAGCGQLFLTHRTAYDQAGGHAVIRTTLHDGVKLPRAYRSAGLCTDLCDATTLARCRMYRSAHELWFGLAKNATEGLAAPRMIIPATLLLFGGCLLPFLLLFLIPWLPTATALVVGVAVFLAWLPRLLGVCWFRQSWLGAFLHPVGLSILLAIQWYALGRTLLGRPAAWKGRAYAVRNMASTLESSASD